LGGDFLCDLCRRAARAIDGARAAAAFRGGLRSLLHAFKYRHATWLCMDLADLLQGCVAAYYETADIDLVVPVPLHPNKQRQRTYNQSALLADILARRLGLETFGDSLRRARATPSQTRLSAAARRANVRGAFEVVRPAWVRGRSVLLVDDVMTTGATLHEAAACLKKAGAWRVWAVAVARG
jgi:ComF family protein